MTKKKPPETEEQRMQRQLDDMIVTRMARMAVKPGTVAFARAHLMTTQMVMAESAYRLAETAKFASLALTALVASATELDRWVGKRTKNARPKNRGRK